MILINQRMYLTGASAAVLCLVSWLQLQGMMVVSSLWVAPLRHYLSICDLEPHILIMQVTTHWPAIGITIVIHASISTQPVSLLIYYIPAVSQSQNIRWCKHQNSHETWNNAMHCDCEVCVDHGHAHSIYRWRHCLVVDELIIRDQTIWQIIISYFVTAIKSWAWFTQLETMLMDFLL